jgi:hypothetical protein
MNYHLKPPKHYRKQFSGSNKLFQKVWEDFLHDCPNCDDDIDVLDYLDSRAEFYVNEEDSEFYLYG